MEEINYATQNFNQKRCIGGGGFGMVYIGKLSKRWQSRTAAIKRLSQDSYQGEHEFRNELEMISKFNHENIISFIGYCDKGNEMIIVYDYAINGSIDHHLQDQNKRGWLTWIQRLKICLGAARGLNYLHSGLGEHDQVIHRDVKSANILLDDNLVAKICDFGLSKMRPQNDPNSKLYTKVAGTQFYVDPIYNESGILRKESDVYSFGVVLFEMVSGMLVHEKRTIGDDIPQSLIKLVRRHHNELDKLIDPSIRYQIDSRSFNKLKKSCMSVNIVDRPTMAKVIDRIEEALNIQLGSSVAPVIQCVMEDMGFSHGVSLAALTVYQSLLHWKYFEAERTIIFYQLFQIIIAATEHENDNDKMANLLSNVFDLLSLVDTTRIHSQTSASKPPPPTFESLFGRKKKHQNENDKMPNLLSNASDLVVSVDTVRTLHAETSASKLPPFGSLFGSKKKTALVQQAPQDNAKNPAYRFKLRLARSIPIMFNIIRDNLKNELRSLLALCIEEARISPISRESSGIDTDLDPCILEHQNCCTFSSGQYLKAGLANLWTWCYVEQGVSIGSQWEELKHIRQAVEFLVIYQKQNLSYHGISVDLCPILNIHQLYRLCTQYVDDNHKQETQTVSEDVISRIREEMTKDGDASNNSYLLEDSSSLLLSINDLSASLKVEHFEGVEAAVELAKCRAFQLKIGLQHITFGQDIA